MNKKRINYENFKNGINKEEFLKYYSSHNIFTTASSYNTNPQNIIRYCKEINYVKDKIAELQNIIKPQDIISYYIEQNHSYRDTLNYFNLNHYSLNKLLKIYKITKK